MSAKCISGLVKRYLTLAGVQDAVEQGEFDFTTGGTKFVTLEEHDQAHHDGHFDPKTMTCNKRKKQESADPVDLDIKKDSDSESGNAGVKRGTEVPSSVDRGKEISREERIAGWRKHLRSLPENAFGDVLQKYGYRDKYPDLYPLLVEERDRRANAEMERWYREYGERA